MSKPSSLTPEGVDAIRKVVVAEFDRIAALPDGSPELLAFNAKLKNTPASLPPRDESKFVNSPPGFGARSSSAAWMDQCRSAGAGPRLPQVGPAGTPDRRHRAAAGGQEPICGAASLLTPRSPASRPMPVGARGRTRALVARQAAERSRAGRRRGRPPARALRRGHRRGGDSRLQNRLRRRNRPPERHRRPSRRTGGRFLDHPTDDAGRRTALPRHDQSHPDVHSDLRYDDLGDRSAQPLARGRRRRPTAFILLPCRRFWTVSA